MHIAHEKMKMSHFMLKKNLERYFTHHDKNDNFDDAVENDQQSEDSASIIVNCKKVINSKVEYLNINQSSALKYKKKMLIYWFCQRL